MLREKSIPEGEPAPDLVSYAKLLRDNNVKLYGASWSADTASQLSLFGDASRYLPYVESGTADGDITSEVAALGITELPTWVFDDGSRASGLLTIEQIVDRTEIFIPAGVTPSFFELPDVAVGIGSPLHVPVDAYDPDDTGLDFEAVSSDPTILQASFTQGNPSVVFTLENYGDIVIELFADRVPQMATRVIDLVNSGYFTDRPLHSLFSGDSITFGESESSPGGGSSFGPLDDAFDADLQFNQPGVFAFARETDDTGNSQFLLTHSPQRAFDFQLPIVGQLIEGERVRAAIDRIPTDGNGAMDADYENRFGTLMIASAKVFDGVDNGLLTLKPTGNATGTVDVQVTVRDADGNQSTQSIEVTISADDFQAGANSAPFLNPIAPVQQLVGEKGVFQLSATDIEGDAVAFDAYRVGDVPYDFAIDSQSGHVTISPPAGFIGPLEILVGVRRAESARSDTPDHALNDFQNVTVLYEGTPQPHLNLEAASDSGMNDSDNVTNVEAPSFVATGLTSGATVELLIGDDVIASATASSEVVRFGDVDLSSRDDGELAFQVRQTINGEASLLTQPLVVTLDRQAPSDSNLNLSAGALATRPFVQSIDHSEEGTGLIYSFASAPAGATIGPTSGRIEWTPTRDDVGTQSLVLRYTDLAGNVFEETLSVDVAETPQAYFEFKFTDLNGGAIEQAIVGDEFLIQVQAVDNRLFASRHIFSAYVDVIFDSNFAVPVGSDPIQFGQNISFARDGSINGNLIDELGGVTDTFDLNPLVLATVRMQAITPGLLSVAGNPAEGIGHEVLTVDSASPVPIAQIDFGRADFTIVKAPQPVQLAMATSIVADPSIENVANLIATTATSGLVDVWADFNNDGDFTDPGEQIIDDHSLDNSSKVIPFTIPAGVTAEAITIAYGLTFDGVLTPVDGDLLTGVPVLQATSQPAVIVQTDGTAINVAANAQGEITVLRDATVVYRAAGSSSLRIVHLGEDSRIVVNSLSDALPASDRFSIAAGTGTDRVVLSGFNGEIDLTDIEHAFSQIEQLEIADNSTLKIDPSGFSRLAPAENLFGLTVETFDAFNLVGDWQFESTEIVEDELVRNLIFGDATIALTGGPDWTNPIEPLDVNGSGTIEPIDALNILNELNFRTLISGIENRLPDPATLGVFPNRFLDTTGDGLLTPLDALRIINRLAITSIGGEAESRPVGRQHVQESSPMFNRQSPEGWLGRPQDDDEDDENGLSVEGIDLYFS
ncbi:MAG: peptidylprolyl isomerase [Pirellulaceae bacterium]